MAFDIMLQRNNSEPNRITKEISEISTVSGELKTETSIIDPVIMIECDLSAIVGCNFISIPTFGRSYFLQHSFYPPWFD